MKDVSQTLTRPVSQDSVVVWQQCGTLSIFVSVQTADVPWTACPIHGGSYERGSASSPECSPCNQTNRQCLRLVSIPWCWWVLVTGEENTDSSFPVCGWFMNETVYIIRNVLYFASSYLCLILKLWCWEVTVSSNNIMVHSFMNIICFLLPVSSFINKVVIKVMTNMCLKKIAYFMIVIFVSITVNLPHLPAFQCRWKETHKFWAQLIVQKQCLLFACI